MECSSNSLAHTQQRKNKDIPEGGSKGVILTTARNADYASAFKRYIDAILDLLIPDPEVRFSHSNVLLNLFNRS